MDKNDFENMIIESMRGENKSAIQLPERDKLLLYLHGLLLITGRFDVMYCNAFLDEAIQLLTNAIFLYEDGLFDCAFYSVRQAGEVVDSMLYLSKNGRGTLEKWSAKDRFPMDMKLKEQLEKLSDDYKEIRSLLPEYFAHHDELIKKSHKIIHKQGFDTFYRLRSQLPEKYDFSQNEETKFFIESLKYTIGIVLIIFIILEPISLALSDEDVTLKLNFNLLTNPIDVDYFKEFLALDGIIDKIKESKFYQEFIANFADKEPMSSAVYSVVREEAWDVEALDEIEQQLDLLNTYERFMFCILKCGIQVSNFYYNGGMSWYFTSIKGNYSRHTFGPNEFDRYLEPDDRFNQPCENIYVSAITMYDEPLFLEHNKPLTNDEIEILREIERRGIQELKKLNEIMADI